jgi:ribosomal protein S18 acetylase RimI-like enzyme
LISIVTLNVQYLKDVAFLHQQYLPTLFSGKAGLQLLKVYYSCIVHAGGACGYVAIEEGLVVGYICGVWNHKLVRKHLLSRHLPQLVVWGIMLVLRNPHSIHEIALRFLGTAPFLTGNRVGLPHSGYELRPIVVKQAYQGTGLASQLISHLIRDALGRGFDGMFLYAEASNSRANAFYEKLGWKTENTYTVGQVTFIRYEIDIVDRLG